MSLGPILGLLKAVFTGILLSEFSENSPLPWCPTRLSCRPTSPGGLPCPGEAFASHRAHLPASFGMVSSPRSPEQRRYLGNISVQPWLVVAPPGSFPYPGGGCPPHSGSWDYLSHPLRLVELSLECSKGCCHHKPLTGAGVEWLGPAFPGPSLSSFALLGRIGISKASFIGTQPVSQKGPTLG